MPGLCAGNRMSYIFSIVSHIGKQTPSSSLGRTEALILSETWAGANVNASRTAVYSCIHYVLHNINQEISPWSCAETLYQATFVVVPQMTWCRCLHVILDLPYKEHMLCFSSNNARCKLTNSHISTIFLSVKFGSWLLGFRTKIFYMQCPGEGEEMCSLILSFILYYQ